MNYDISDSIIRSSAPDRLPEKFSGGDTLTKFIYLDMATDTAREAVLIGFVASLRIEGTFKVYYDFGTRHDAHYIRVNGMKVRAEEFARNLFPMLAEWEFLGF